MGPKKTKFVWEKFKVVDIEGLKELAESGKLTDVKGWGERSVTNILKGIESFRKFGTRMTLPAALSIAEEIVERLHKTKLCKQIEIAGSLRRRKESIGDIDILATGKNADAI